MRMPRLSGERVGRRPGEGACLAHEASRCLTRPKLGERDTLPLRGPETESSFIFVLG